MSIFTDTPERQKYLTSHLHCADVERLSTEERMSGFRMRCQETTYEHDNINTRHNIAVHTAMPLATLNHGG